MGNGTTVTQAWTKGHADDDDDDGDRDLSEVGTSSTEIGRQRSFSASGICIPSEGGASSAGSIPMEGESSSLPMSLSRSLSMGIAAGYAAAEAQAASAGLTPPAPTGTSGSSTPTPRTAVVLKTPVSKPSANDSMEDEMFDMDIVHNSNSSESGNSSANDESTASAPVPSDHVSPV